MRVAAVTLVALLRPKRPSGEHRHRRHRRHLGRRRRQLLIGSILLGAALLTLLACVAYLYWTGREV